MKESRQRDKPDKVMSHSRHKTVKNFNLQNKSLFNTTKLYNHTALARLYQDPRLLTRLATELGKSSQQKQTTQTW